jgi:thiamine biosynthesis protein ThiI
MGVVLIRYGEIGLKGRNRMFFVLRLRRNIKDCLRRNGLPGEVRVVGQRLWVDTDSPDEVARHVADVFGVVSVSPAQHVPLKIEAIGQEAVRAAIEAGLAPGMSFRVHTRRANKGFPLTSPEINALVGDRVQEATGAMVDLSEAAEYTIGIEIARDAALVFGRVVPGPGGLPLNTQGRVIALLSGGIDSPVAVYLMMRRGCAVIPLHFRQSDVEASKALDNCRALERYSAGWHLQPIVEDHAAVMEPIVTRLRELREERWICLFCKHALLMRAAEVAGALGAQAIVTGESLGQVASQTLPNMEAISSGVPKPVLRPLIGYDKTEVIALARKIGTYDVSTREAVGCRYVPANPITMADMDKWRDLVDKVNGNST